VVAGPSSRTRRALREPARISPTEFAANISENDWALSPEHERAHHAVGEQHRRAQGEHSGERHEAPVLQHHGQLAPALADPGAGPQPRREGFGHRPQRGEEKRASHNGEGDEGSFPVREAEQLAAEHGRQYWRGSGD
jgi:hypothetical protein